MIIYSCIVILSFCVCVSVCDMFHSWTTTILASPDTFTLVNAFYDYPIVSRLLCFCIIHMILHYKDVCQYEILRSLYAYLITENYTTYLKSSYSYSNEQHAIYNGWHRLYMYVFTIIAHPYSIMQWNEQSKISKRIQTSTEKIMIIILTQR